MAVYTDSSGATAKNWLQQLKQTFGQFIKGGTANDNQAAQFDIPDPLSNMNPALIASLDPTLKARIDASKVALKTAHEHAEQSIADAKRQAHDLVATAKTQAMIAVDAARNAIKSSQKTENPDLSAAIKRANDMVIAAQALGQSKIDAAKTALDQIQAQAAGKPMSLEVQTAINNAMTVLKNARNEARTVLFTAQQQARKIVAQEKGNDKAVLQPLRDNLQTALKNMEQQIGIAEKQGQALIQQARTNGNTEIKIARESLMALQSSATLLQNFDKHRPITSGSGVFGHKNLAFNHSHGLMNASSFKSGGQDLSKWAGQLTTMKK